MENARLVCGSLLDFEMRLEVPRAMESSAAMARDTVAEYFCVVVVAESQHGVWCNHATSEGAGERARLSRQQLFARGNSRNKKAVLGFSRALAERVSGRAVEPEDLTEAR